MLETRHPENAGPAWLNRILFTAAFLLFALRYLWPGDSVYILDEAYQQIRIDEHFQAGTIPFSNSRGSSIPLPYGPGALWFFMLIRLFTWSPIALFYCHLTFVVLGAVIFIRTIRAAYGTEASAWCALLIAASPLLFFFSRHTWDGTLQITLAALLCWLLQKLRDGAPEVPTHLALGVVAGYGVNIHLMFGPVAIAAGLTLVYLNAQRHGWRRARFWTLLACFGGAALLVLAPYLTEAFRIAREEKPLEHARNKEHWGDGRNLWWIFLRTTLFSSLFNSRLHLEIEGVRDVFFASVGKLRAYFFRVDLFGWPGKIAAWGLAFGTLFGLLRGRPGLRPLPVFAACAFFGTLVIYQFLNIPTAPHYFNPLWWFVFVGIAAAIARLRGWWKRAFLATVTATVLVNTVYIASVMAFVHENRGARNMDTSVVVGEQLRAFRELCDIAHTLGRAELRVDKTAALWADPPFEFLPKHMPECQGVKLTLVGAGEPADVRVHHPADSQTSAALVIERAQP